MLVDDYRVNQTRLEQNATELEQAQSQIKRTIRNQAQRTETGQGLMDIINDMGLAAMILSQAVKALVDDKARLYVVDSCQRLDGEKI